MSRLRALAGATALLALTACGSTVAQTGAAGPAVPGAVGGDGLSVPGAAAPQAGAAGGAPGASTSGAAGFGGAPGSVAGGTTGGGAAPGAVAGGGTTGGAGGTTGGAAAPAGAIPAKGPGWDEKNVYIGVGTQKDVQTAFETVGVSGLNAGDQEGQARAIAAELNRQGGLFGRQVTIVFRDHATIATAQDPNSTAQATCTYFTQDRPVIAYLNPVTLMDGPVLRSCFAKARVPLISASLASLDNKATQTYAPYFLPAIAPTWDPLTRVLIARLKAQGYFGGWDPATSKAVPGKAKVGVLIKSDDVSPRVLAMLTRAIEAAGAPGVETYSFRDGSEMSSAVLQFRGRGVTHVVSTDGALLAFMLSADDQNYRPRYALSSFLTPAVFLEPTAPRRQLVGSIGIGWSPSIDVADARDPGDSGPGETECKRILAKGGQTFQGKRLAEAVAFAFCDGLRLIVASAKSSGGLTGPQLAQGIRAAGPQLSSAFSFGNGLTAGHTFVPGAVRDIAYSTDCACFAYVSRTNHRL